MGGEQKVADVSASAATAGVHSLCLIEGIPRVSPNHRPNGPPTVDHTREGDSSVAHNGRGRRPRENNPPPHWASFFPLTTWEERPDNFCSPATSATHPPRPLSLYKAVATSALTVAPGVATTWRTPHDSPTLYCFETLMRIQDIATLHRRRPRARTALTSTTVGARLPRISAASSSSVRTQDR